MRVSHSTAPRLGSRRAAKGGVLTDCGGHGERREISRASSVSIMQICASLPNRAADGRLGERYGPPHPRNISQKETIQSLVTSRAAPLLRGRPPSASNPKAPKPGDPGHRALIGRERSTGLIRGLCAGYPGSQENIFGGGGRQR